MKRKFLQARLDSQWTQRAWIENYVY